MAMIGRLAACMGIDAILLGTAVLVLGRPDLEQARTFAVGDYPTFAAAQAALEILLWAIVVGVAGGVTASVVSDALRGALRTNLRQHQLAAVLAAAILLLIAATLRHSSTAVVMCCGDPSEALRVAR